MGVLAELKRIRSLSGFRFTVGGNVPIGSGLSSSAALEMATCTAMEGLFGFTLEDKEAALLTQRAENVFVGVNCGIMDQFISRTGKAGHAVKIDCTDLSIQRIAINLPGYSWIIIDSRKRRGLVDSEYNNRRKECEEGTARARELFPKRNIMNLRDLSVDDLPALKKVCSKTVFQRVRHAVTENERVRQTIAAFGRKDAEAVGRNLYASHASLRDDFQVSCEELDLLVNILSGSAGVAGARLTGAGFGGCVIALVKSSEQKEIVADVIKQYHPKSLKAGDAPVVWPVEIMDGAKWRKFHEEMVMASA
jgi:galactokinase